MKSTGIVRKVDELGRIVIPKETRDVLGIANGDPLEIFSEKDKLILRKYIPGCLFCNDAETVEFKGKRICLNCLEKLKEL